MTLCVISMVLFGQFCNISKENSYITGRILVDTYSTKLDIETIVISKYVATRYSYIANVVAIQPPNS